MLTDEFFLLGASGHWRSACLLSDGSQRKQQGPPPPPPLDRSTRWASFIFCHFSLLLHRCFCLALVQSIVRVCAEESLPGRTSPPTPPQRRGSSVSPAARLAKMASRAYAGSRADVNNESLFRSATMSLVQFYIPAEVAHSTVTELGELGNVQFKDVSREDA